MTKRTLVLGATSLIGRFLPPHMVHVELIGAGRGAGAPGYPSWTTLDLAAPGDELAGALQGSPPATVLSLCPIWLLPPALPELIRCGMTRLVAVSSTSRWTKVASPDPSERATAARLAAAEKETSAACEAGGVAWTILRPTLIYAEGQDGNVSRLAALARRLGLLPISGRGEGRRQPVHADDLAAAVADVLAAPETVDRAYDLPGGETLTYADMCRRVFAGLDLPARLLHVPPPIWRAGLALASPLLPGATAAMGARMAEDLVFDAGPAQRDFGWSPRRFRPDFRQSA